jgi:hypothetical protein
MPDTTTNDTATFTDRYIALWNEPDAGRRRATIEALWAPTGANYTASKAAVGYDELDARVTSAYEAYVGTGEYNFRAGTPAAAHHDAVKVEWEMVTVATDTVASVGLEFLVLDADGRIVSDHQFIVR